MAATSCAEAAHAPLALRAGSAQTTSCHLVDRCQRGLLRARRRVEAAAIIAIVVLNTVIGVIQEWRAADHPWRPLKKLAARDARVIRDGAHATIPARELVPGDVVLLETGNFVPADVRLTESIICASRKRPSRAIRARGKAAALVLEREIPAGRPQEHAFMGRSSPHGRGTGVVVAGGHFTRSG